MKERYNLNELAMMTGMIGIVYSEDTEVTEVGTETAERVTETESAPEAAPEEHIPTIEETIELPKDIAPEKSSEAADEILAAVESKADEEQQEAKEAKEEAEAGAEEVLPAQKKADVVFAQENEVIPSIIEDKEKALTGEDHSGRNLLNIVVFGGIALIILLVLLIKM